MAFWHIEVDLEEAEVCECSPPTLASLSLTLAHKSGFSRGEIECEAFGTLAKNHSLSLGFHEREELNANIHSFFFSLSVATQHKDAFCRQEREKKTCLGPMKM